jgi:Fe-S oxidoreductase
VVVDRTRIDGPVRVSADMPVHGTDVDAGGAADTLQHYDEYKELPYASSLCAACTEACPVKIPLHELLLKP